MCMILVTCMQNVNTRVCVHMSRVRGKGTRICIWVCNRDTRAYVRGTQYTYHPVYKAPRHHIPKAQFLVVT